MGRHTGHRCEAVVGWNETTGGHPVLELCPREAVAFHQERGPMRFGMWLCHQHADIGAAPL